MVSGSCLCGCVTGRHATRGLNEYDGGRRQRCIRDRRTPLHILVALGLEPTQTRATGTGESTGVARVTKLPCQTCTQSLVDGPLGCCLNLVDLQPDFDMVAEPRNYNRQLNFDCFDPVDFR